MFDELVEEVTKRIEATEGRERSRRQTDQQCFEHSVSITLADLWKSVRSIPLAECSINKRSGYYSGVPKRYRDPLLTFRQHIAVHEGLLKLGFIEITHNGYFDRETFQGAVTKFIARDELRERLLEIDEHPALSIIPDITSECIILRDTVDGQRTEIDYTDTPATDKYRANLQLINKCFLKHWPDIELKDTDYLKLGEAISSDEKKLPIDLSKRTLVRIFSNGSFKSGGRFYRGWWQNVPSEYRKYITIDEFVTTEYDYSQLSPHMLYFAYNYEMGNEDAYDRVLDGEHRDVVKQAFNAMVQSSTQLLQKPEKVNMDGLEMTWRELRDRILEAHRPIQHLFFKGIGNKLQYTDSCIAESVMLQFAELNRMTLPIHDSFIMRQGYAGDLEEAMRRAFYNEFQSDIPIKHEVIVERVALFEDDGTPRTEAVIKDDREHLQWYDRNTMWLVIKG